METGHMTTQQEDKTFAFGRFEPGKEELPLREFEIVLRINARSGPLMWSSRIPCIDHLLKHLMRYSKSQASRDTYLRHVKQYMDFHGLNPEDLTNLSKSEAERLVQGFVDHLDAKGRTR